MRRISSVLLLHLQEGNTDFLPLVNRHAQQFHNDNPSSNAAARQSIMEDQVDFDINESLKLYLSDAATIPTPEANPELLDCENDPDSITTGLVNNVLDPVVDLVAESPEGLMRSSAFDTVQFYLKCVPMIALSTANPLPGTCC